jgi:apolipoprotein D and lipocalin family protein
MICSSSLISTALLFAATQSSPGSVQLAPVSGFEISRYLGTWYEIARMPSWFEKDLVNTTANYSLMENGMVRVVNEGHKKSADGKRAQAKGKAKFASAHDIGHLKVSFFEPFYADYVILSLDKENYQYAMVGSNKLLWILSRTPQLDKDIIEAMLAKAKESGFNLDKLIYVSQDWHR